MSTAFIKHNELSVVLFMDQILKPSQSCASSSPTSDRRILSGKKFGPFVRSVRSVCSGPFGPFVRVHTHVHSVRLFDPCGQFVRVHSVPLFGSIRSFCLGSVPLFGSIRSERPRSIRSLCSICAVSLFGSIRSLCSGPFGPFVWVFSGPFGPFVRVHSVRLFGSIRSVSSGPFGPFVRVHSAPLFGSIRYLKDPTSTAVELEEPCK